MPLYEYECEQCHVSREVRHPADENYTEPCPQCGGALKRLFFPAAIHFIGSGWHINDYSGDKSSSATSKRETSQESAKSAKRDSPGTSGTAQPTGLSPD